MIKDKLIFLENKGFELEDIIAGIKAIKDNTGLDTDKVLVLLKIMADNGMVDEDSNPLKDLLEIETKVIGDNSAFNNDVNEFHLLFDGKGVLNTPKGVFIFDLVNDESEKIMLGVVEPGLNGPEGIIKDINEIFKNAKRRN